MRVLSSFVFALVLSGCGPKTDAPQVKEITAALQAAFPTTEIANLKSEVAVAPQPGVLEIACKVTLRFKTDHFAAQVRRADPFGDAPAVGFTAECVRRQILPAAALRDIHTSTEANELADIQEAARPRFESIGEPQLLTLKHAAGSVVDVYGTILAKKFVDRWDFSPFQPQREIPDFGQPRDKFEGKTLVMDSKEYEEALAAVGALAKARSSTIAARDAKFLALLQEERTFCGKHGDFSIRLKLRPVSKELAELEIVDVNRPTRVRRAQVYRRPHVLPLAYTKPELEHYRSILSGTPVSKLTFNNDWIGFLGGVFGASRTGSSHFYLAVDASGFPRLLSDERDTLTEVRVCEGEEVVSQISPTPTVRNPPASSLPNSQPPRSPAIGPATLAKTARAHAILQRKASGTRAEAIKLYLEAAGEGDPDAMVNLAHLLRSGKDGVQDLEAAKRFYRSAADAGNIEAKLALESIARTGR